ncbi:MAG TPA: hypothetical protein DIU07_13280 [Rhodobacteraceae bacterium]|nr:hypothetical protein [Paracoccaceae bacterium]
MKHLFSGFAAGLVVTVFLSALMVAKSIMGVMPALDVIAMMGAVMGTGALVGWLAHFMIGTLAWGGGFALLYDVILGHGATAKGVAFGIAAWAGMMIMVMVMPMAGAGFFGLAMGMMAPMMTLVLHIMFGAVLGATFQALASGRLALA